MGTSISSNSRRSEPDSRRESSGLQSDGTGSSRLEKFFEAFGRWICYTSHSHKDLTRPVNGKYRCLECMREYKASYE